MLEIIALVLLTRKIGQILEAKGRKSGWFKVLTVVLWFGGEIAGAIVVAVATGGAEGAQVYVGALVGAVLGAVLAFVIASSAAPAATDTQDGPVG